MIFQSRPINILTPCIECRYDGAGGWRGPEGGSPADTNSDSGTVAQFVFVGPCGRFVVVEFSYQNSPARTVLYFLPPDIHRYDRYQFSKNSRSNESYYYVSTSCVNVVI